MSCLNSVLMFYVNFVTEENIFVVQSIFHQIQSKEKHNSHIVVVSGLHTTTKSFRNLKHESP